MTNAQKSQRPLERSETTSPAGQEPNPRPEGASFGGAPVEETHPLLQVLERAAEVLPNQPPIRLFVHHNPLHAYEHLAFDVAVTRTAKRLGAEPYLSEVAFAEHLRSGRVRGDDIDAVLEAAGVSQAPVFHGGPSEREFKSMRLRHAFETPSGAALRWVLEETDALRACYPSVSTHHRARLTRDTAPGSTGIASESEALSGLWRLLEAQAPVRSTAACPSGLRHSVSSQTGVDIDDWINPLLIRLCAAFVDQGVAYWKMPFQEAGLYEAFIRLYRMPAGPPSPWMSGLRAELGRQCSRGWSAAQTVAGLLQELGYPEAQWQQLLEGSLLSLPGWAGMIRQLELRPDRAPVRAPAAKLVDFVAVRLTLEVVAARYALSALPRRGHDLRASNPSAEDSPNPVVYEAFISAQLLGLGPASFQAPGAAKQWLGAVAAFDSLERRRLLHLAYERRHRVGVLDALLSHARQGTSEPAKPQVQALFCLDEREESLRRHFEELMPSAQTFGCAGYFGVAMAYQGLDDIKPVPLCPVSVTPRHWVQEVANDERAASAAARRARMAGGYRRWFQVGSTTAVRGGVISALLGLLSVFPLVLRCLFPRASARLGHEAHGALTSHPHTRLALERVTGDERCDNGLWRGFSVAEMATIVATTLRPLGVGQLAPVFLVIGHGSSSLNNPHEAAHDCGACGGGRGGPNARAFAAMANHPRVREALREQHRFEIPGSAWFVAGYHDTCNDAITYYDTDLIPHELRKAFEGARAQLEQARRWDAHERCRRFEDALPPLTAGTSATAWTNATAGTSATAPGRAPQRRDLERSLATVEAHAVDLGQPRPEYGHATNAVCVIGRRSRTRGLFLDRRAFLVSYDLERDPEGELLAPLLESVGPVGAGINLEYYFSFVDNQRYGCGTKLPHNITGLIGVMDGHASDLRTGLPWQMVEIHEPVRLLTIVEAEFPVAVRALKACPSVARLVANGWIQLVVWSPSENQMRLFDGGQLIDYHPQSEMLPRVEHSWQHYLGKRHHLGYARIEGAPTDGSRVGAARVEGPRPSPVS